MYDAVGKNVSLQKIILLIDRNQFTFELTFKNPKFKTNKWCNNYTNMGWRREKSCKINKENVSEECWWIFLDRF